MEDPEPVAENPVPEAAPADPEAPVEETKAKKKRKPKKRKPKGAQAAAKAGGLEDQTRFQDNSHIILLKNWEEKPGYKQTSPPTIPINDQFPNGGHAPGTEVPYENENAFRTTSAELRERERLMEYDYDELRKAADVHRQVRKWAQSVLKPGINLYNFVEELENHTRHIIGGDSMERGVGFPTGVSLNHCAAHWTPNPSDQNVVLQYDDVCKVDFGTQINGKIIDCAFTCAFNPKFENLLMAPKEATAAGIKTAGIDVRLCDIGEAIQEVMESHEVELDGRTYPIKCVRNLNGHLIAPYHIHAGKSVPLVKNEDRTRMEEGEMYAIETFGSTGKGVVHDDGESSHFMADWDMAGEAVPIRDGKAKALHAHIKNKYGTLPWSRRQLQADGQTKHLMPLKRLCDQGVIVAYPPLCDVPGSFVAQYEHTILLRPTCKELISVGDDF